MLNRNILACTLAVFSLPYQSSEAAAPVNYEHIHCIACSGVPGSEPAFLLPTTLQNGLNKVSNDGPVLGAVRLLLGLLDDLYQQHEEWNLVLCRLAEAVQPSERARVDAARTRLEKIREEGTRCRTAAMVTLTDAARQEPQRKPDQRLIKHIDAVKASVIVERTGRETIVRSCIDLVAQRMQCKTLWPKRRAALEVGYMKRLEETKAEIGEYSIGPIDLD
jgi:hypothetical protein